MEGGNKGDQTNRIDRTLSEKVSDSVTESCRNVADPLSDRCDKPKGWVGDGDSMIMVSK